MFSHLLHSNTKTDLGVCRSLAVLSSFIITFFIYGEKGTHFTFYMWNSEDSPQESVLSFLPPRGFPMDRTQVAVFSGKHFHPLSHLTSTNIIYFKV